MKLPCAFHKTSARAFFLGAALWAAPVLAQDKTAPDQPQTHLPRVELTAGMYRIDAQLAATPAARQKGLMYRRSMAQHEGMLFVFEQPAMQCFWMRNTPLPLTAAFVADDGTIINLADMQPMTENSHCAAQPVRYVLEMHQGWFARRGLKAGSKLGGAVFAAGGKE